MEIYLSIGSFLIIVSYLLHLYLKTRLFPNGSVKKTIFYPFIVNIISSEAYQKATWVIRAILRPWWKIPTLKLWIRADDPYSFLLLQLVNSFLTRWTLDLEILVLPILKEELSEVEVKYRNWICKDANVLAELYEIEPPGGLTDKNKEHMEQITYRMVKMASISTSSNQSHVSKKKLVGELLRLMKATSSVDLADDFEKSNLDKTLTENFSKLSKLEFINLPGFVEFEGECYGINRLCHLEMRLGATRLEFNRELNFIGRKHKKENYSEIASYSVEFVRSGHDQLEIDRSNSRRCHVGGKIDFYYSFRSPYSQLALHQLKKICYEYDITLNILPVMPMVMRGLASHLPTQKLVYILKDSAREARIRGVNSFGYFCDPVTPNGEGIRRLFCLYRIAKEKGNEFEMLQMFAESTWGRGCDVNTDYDLEKLCNSILLSWKTLQNEILKTQTDDGWKELPIDNLSTMEALGFWGVPCICYEDVMIWGQDKIWAIEALLYDKANMLYKDKFPLSDQRRSIVEKIKLHYK